MEDLRRQMQHLEKELVQKQRAEVEDQRVKQSERISDLATVLGSLELVKDPQGSSGSPGNQAGTGAQGEGAGATVVATGAGDEGDREMEWSKILERLKAQEEALKEAEEEKEFAEDMNKHFMVTDVKFKETLQAAEKAMKAVRALALARIEAFTPYSLSAFLHPCVL